MVDRETIFISHATPGDNAFTIWLASRLTLAGYKVWCDADKLIGGEDFWQEIEETIRNETVKFILVVSQNAFDARERLRDGIAKEVAVAGIMKKQLADDHFILPVRIDQTDFSKFPIDFVRLNGIDCAHNWADGLEKVFKVLTRDEIPLQQSPSSDGLKSWVDVHQHHARAISDTPETLQSNWLPIKHIPEILYFYQNPGAQWHLKPRVIASQCPIPCFDHGRLLASFAELAEMREALGSDVPITDRGQVRTVDFVRGITTNLSNDEPNISGISAWDAKNKMSSLLRQAWDIKLKAMGLNSYEMANGHISWWFPQDLIKDGQLRFEDFGGKQRRRAVSGIKGKTEMPDGSIVAKYHWHLGFSGRVMLTENPFIILQPRIIISEDGKTPLPNKTRLNSVRRSLTKMWFNDKWRTLTLGFATWLADENGEIHLEVADGSDILLDGAPDKFSLDVGISSDPPISDLSDELAEEIEKSEIAMKLGDPAFAYLRKDEEVE